MPQKPDPKRKKPGRKPENSKPFDDRTMLRMFKAEHASWKHGAAILGQRLGVKLSVGAFIRHACNALAADMHKPAVKP